MKEFELIEQYFERKLKGKELETFEQKLKTGQGLRNKLKSFQGAIKLMWIYNKGSW